MGFSLLALAEARALLSIRKTATSLIGIGQAPSLIARSDPEPIGIAPFLPIIRYYSPLSSSTGSLVVVLSGFNKRIWRSFTKWVGS